MSIAVLARKTREKHNNRTCGHILNMTGRGGGIGRFGFAGKPTSHQNKCLGGKCKTQNQSCCDNNTANVKYNTNKTCSYDGLSQPAPQMSYRTYLNKKSNGAYRPGSKVCCDNGTDNKNIVKKTTILSLNEITEIKKQEAERMYSAMNLNMCDLNTSGQSGQSTETTQSQDDCKNSEVWDTKLQCHVKKLKYKPRLSYTRINTTRCVTTKPMSINQTASDVIQKRKAEVYKKKCTEIDQEYPNRNIKSYCDCEKQTDWDRNEINKCKIYLARLEYPKLCNAVSRLSLGCRNGKVANPCKKCC